MTTLTIQFEPDPDDGGNPLRMEIDTAKGGQFFAAWVNPFGLVEWTNTDEIHGGDTFADLQQMLEESES